MGTCQEDFEGDGKGEDGCQIKKNPQKSLQVVTRLVGASLDDVDRGNLTKELSSILKNTKGLEKVVIMKMWPGSVNVQFAIITNATLEAEDVSNIAKDFNDYLETNNGSLGGFLVDKEKTTIMSTDRR